MIGTVHTTTLILSLPIVRKTKNEAKQIHKRLCHLHQFPCNVLSVYVNMISMFNQSFCRVRSASEGDVQLAVSIAARLVERSNVRTLRHKVLSAYVHGGAAAVDLQAVDATMPGRTHRFKELWGGLPLKAQREMQFIWPCFSRQSLQTFLSKAL